MLGLLVLAMLAAPSPPAAADFPVGAVVPRVECSDTPGQSYALYLPPGYARGRSWPVLFLFDPRARGSLAAEIFSGPAARYGWILVSSNNTQSDGSVDPNITALRAMWRDAQARFPIDPRRVYAGGFSGGARLATLMATTAPGTVAGVIGCGAGFHLPVAKKPPFVYFGAVGNRDFNYSEMRELGAKLDSLGAVHRTEHFDGEHDWPPPETCLDAVEWMEVEAIRAGAAHDGDGELDAIFRKRSERAAGLETARPAEALAEYRAIETDFASLRDVSAAHSAAIRLEHSRDVQKAISEEAKSGAQELRAREGFVPVWAEIRSGEAVLLVRLVQELHIPELREKAARRPVSDDSLSAQRLLNEIAAQASFYLARGYRGEKNHARELLCLSIATQARPDWPPVWFRRAEARAAAGDSEQALGDLAKAVELGFAMPESLETDDDFAALRKNERFQKLLAAARANAEKAPEPTR